MNQLANIRMVWETFGSFRFRAGLLFTIVVTSALFEALGIGMVLPLLQTAIAPSTKNMFFVRVLTYFSPNLHLLVVCLITLVTIFLKGVFRLLRYYFSSKFINDLRLYWATGIMRNYLSSRYPSIIKQKQGVLMNNMVHEPTYASKALRDLVDFFANGLIALSIMVLLVAVNWLMTLVLIALSALVVLLLWNVTHRYSLDVGRRKIELNQAISQIASESIAGIRQLKIFSLENLVLKEFSDALQRLVRTIVGFKVVTSLPLVLGEVIIVIIFVGLLLLYRYWMKGDVTALIPVLGLFIVGAVRLSTCVSELLSMRMSLLSFWPSLSLVRGLASDQSTWEKDMGTAPAIRPEVCISLKNVNYVFEGGATLFRDLSLEIPKGKITSVVGPSGSGKSTLCDLITRLESPTSGKILVDGIDLSSFRIRSWREHVGYVSQECFLFNSTVRENISSGRLGCSDEEIFQASKLAGAAEFINALPAGYETVVGEGGIALSGGQRQKIAIARVFVRNPGIIIFDEATSALDNESEHGVLDSLRKIARDKTILFITHRLSSLNVADLIYVLDHGKVSEAGSYEQLITMHGVFWHLVNLSQNEAPKTPHTSS